MSGRRQPLAIGLLLLSACAGGPDDGVLAPDEVGSSEAFLTPAACPGNAEACSGTSDVLGSCLLTVGETQLRAEVAQTFRISKAGYAGQVRLFLKKIVAVAPSTDPELRIELRALVNGKVPLDTASTVAVARIKASALPAVDGQVTANFTSTVPLSPSQTYAIVLRVPEPALLNVGVGCHRAEAFSNGVTSTRRRQLLAGSFYSNPPFVDDTRDLSFSISLDDGCVPGQTRTCGVGSCLRAVPTCIDGQTNPCTAGNSTAEVCNNIDDDCDGAVDNAPTAQLCPPPSNMATTVCTGGACGAGTCAANYFNIDGAYPNGCECNDPATSSATCASATDLGTLGVGGVATSPVGRVPTTAQSDWFLVRFPTNYDLALHAPGTPRVTFLANDSSAFRFEIRRSLCTAGVECSSTLTDWSMVDNTAMTPGDAYTGAPMTWGGPWTMGPFYGGPGQWSSRATTWPTDIYIRVWRPSGTDCGNYQIRVTR